MSCKNEIISTYNLFLAILFSSNWLKIIWSSAVRTVHLSLSFVTWVSVRSCLLVGTWSDLQPTSIARCVFWDAGEWQLLAACWTKNPTSTTKYIAFLFLGQIAASSGRFPVYSFAPNETTERCQLACSDAFWFAWIFFSVKRNQTNFTNLSSDSVWKQPDLKDLLLSPENTKTQLISTLHQTHWSPKIIIIIPWT